MNLTKKCYFCTAMTDIQFQQRVIDNQDWAIILFVLSFSLVAIIRSSFETRFNDFANLIVSDKYIKIYKDYAHLMSWFTIILFIVQLLSLSFFLQLLLDYFGYYSKYDFLLFIKIFTFLNIFVLSKFLIEKIVATAFNIEEFLEQFNLIKVSYRTYIAIVLLPINAVLFFNKNIDILYINIIFIVVLVLNLAIYIKSVKIYQNLIIANLFYFILYLCTLEIGPYYFIYYWFTKR